MKSKNLIIFLVIILIVLGIAGGAFLILSNHKEDIDSNVIVFKDKELEKIIKKELGKDEITYDDALELELLYVFDKPVESIEDLVYFKNLKTLSLTGVEVRNLKYIEGLDKLKHLIIREGRLNDLSGIEKLNDLEYIAFGRNEIDDISKLSSLKKLRYIDLQMNLVSDLTPLENLDNLQTLSLTYNLIDDCSPLTKLKKLRDFDFQDLINGGNTAMNLELLKGLSKTMFDNAVNDPTMFIGVGEDDILTVDEETYTSYDEALARFQARERDMQEYEKTMAIARTFIKNNIKDTMSEQEKVKVISKYIITLMEYDHDMDSDLSHIAYYYTFISKYGICHHYASSFSLLAKLAGLESYYIGSTSHAWNIVKVGDKFYHVDTTWGDAFEDVDWQYILTSTKRINELHAFDIDKSSSPIVYKVNISEDEILSVE